MLHRLRDYEQLTLHAADGELGQIEDFIFDDEQWTTRYLVASTGTLFGRSVAISPISVVRPDWVTRRLVVQLSREQIRDSPDLFAARPITQSAEEEYAAYYGYPAYWGGPGLWAWAGAPGALASPAPASYVVQHRLAKEGLHYVSELRGAHLRATDAEIGHVDDLLIDEQSWTAHHLLVDTSNWIGGRHVLIGVRDVKDVDWIARVAAVQLTEAQVRGAPAYEPGATISSAT